MFNVLRSTVLKVGHHGSSTSTSDEFLKAVDPSVAVISVGKHNRYRHPSPSTLKKLELTGVKVYRTDESGAVTVRTDGKTFSVESQKQRRYPRIRLPVSGYQGPDRGLHTPRRAGTGRRD